MKIKLVPSAKNNLAANFWQLYSNEAMHWLAACRTSIRSQRGACLDHVPAQRVHGRAGRPSASDLQETAREQSQEQASQHRSTGRALCWTWDFSSGVWCSLDFETVMRQSGRQRGLFCTWNSKIASHRKNDIHSHSFTWGWSARGCMWTHWVTTTPFSKEKLPKLMVQSTVNRKSCELRSDFYASQTDLSANLLCSLNAGILISFYQEKLHFFQEICAQYFS